LRFFHLPRDAEKKGGEQNMATKKPAAKKKTAKKTAKKK
jgi:hypothetical protein